MLIEIIEMLFQLLSNLFLSNLSKMSLLLSEYIIINILIIKNQSGSNIFLIRNVYYVCFLLVLCFLFI